MVDTTQKPPVTAFVRWLTYHYNKRLPIRVDFEDGSDAVGHVVGFNDGLLALQTTDQDVIIIPVTFLTRFHGSYPDGVPEPLPGFPVKLEMPK